MASTRKLPNGRYQARWRAWPGGPQTAKTFTRKVDADRWLVNVQHDLLSGTYVALEARRMTVEDYYGQWVTRMAPTWRPATLRTVRNSFGHILPVLGTRPLVAVRKADVEALAGALPLAPSSVRLVARHLAMMFTAAVADDLLPRSPIQRLRLPRVEAEKARPLPLDTIEAIRVALPDWMRVVVPLGVGAGLRQGEVSGLTVDRVQFLRRTLLVDRQLDDETSLLVGPKSDAAHRTIPLPGFVVEALSAHLATFPGGPGDLVVRAPGGLPVDSDRFGRQWRRACATAGVPGTRYHQLRHTFASTLLSRGVSVKAVGSWLGHANPAVTLTVYAHLMPDDPDLARRVLDDVFSAAEDSLRTDGTADSL